MDLIGISTLAATGLGTMILGNRVVERRIDLALGAFNADNTPPDDWDRMNRGAGAAVAQVGRLMLIFAAVALAASFVLPDKVAGAASLAVTIIGGFGIAMAAARHAVAPSPDWHP